MSQANSNEASLKSYVVGFGLSLVLTLASYLLVAHHSLGRDGLLAATTVFALSQFFVQMRFFLHLGIETKPRWKLLVFCFMTGVVLILVLGSLWIMNNLNYRMTPAEIKQYLQNQDGGI
ncbi:MAG TPA: cytochrome o ubiquinol oxidase subunit IV [Candidatus Saccharimonadales bacterium]|nr:cytochrome o ubiquinol oxidase subunit IV [Candidatus Saccharimonadales bacterium]